METLCVLVVGGVLDGGSGIVGGPRACLRSRQPEKIPSSKKQEKSLQQWLFCSDPRRRLEPGRPAERRASNSWYWRARTNTWSAVLEGGSLNFFIKKNEEGCCKMACNISSHHLQS
eukprot:COSAG05_NODE_10677_length_552_cov_0.997792_1_plen_116_part_00